MNVAGALQAYRKAVDLKRAAAQQDREARRKKLQRARRVRATRYEEAHALENGDSAPPTLEVNCLCPCLAAVTHGATKCYGLRQIVHAPKGPITSKPQAHNNTYVDRCQNVLSQASCLA